MRITKNNLRKIIVENINSLTNLKHAASFIYRSNEIEDYIEDIEDVMSALEGVIEGYPVSYVTRSPYIKAQIEGIQATTTFDSRKGKTLAEALEVHRAMGSDVLDSGVPGMLRDNEARSSGGTQYIEPSFIAEAMSWWEMTDFEDLFERHAVYELIHPFSDGNGRSGRILLLSSMDYDYFSINQLIDQDYFNRLDVYNEKYKKYFLERGWL
tara:strand:- start:179 stop:811 length:633 start_codon:yes stop_codon:yes gene_type:complete